MDIVGILSSIQEEIDRLTQARELLTGANKDAKRAPRSAADTASPARKKRVLSDEARAKIAAAQKKRWAIRGEAAKKPDH